MRPSLGPGPKFATRYMAPPKPVTKTPKNASTAFATYVSNVGKKGSIYYNTNAIMIALRMVPMPSVCLSGIHNINTIALIINVANPRLKPVTLVTPSANMVQGLTPTPAVTSNASPKPNTTRPIIRNATDANGGFMVKAFGELHRSFGTDVTERKLKDVPYYEVYLCVMRH